MVLLCAKHQWSIQVAAQRNSYVLKIRLTYRVTQKSDPTQSAIEK